MGEEAREIHQLKLGISRENQAPAAVGELLTCGFWAEETQCSASLVVSPTQGLEANPNLVSYCTPSFLRPDCVSRRWFTRAPSYNTGTIAPIFPLKWHPQFAAFLS